MSKFDDELDVFDKKDSELDNLFGNPFDTLSQIPQDGVDTSGAPPNLQFEEQPKEGDFLKKLVTFINSGPGGRPGVFSDPEGFFMNEGGPGFVDAAKSVSGGAVSGVTLGLLEPFKDDEVFINGEKTTIGELNSYAGGEFVGSLAPFGAAGKVARLIPGLRSTVVGSKLLQTVQATGRGAVAGGILGTGQETVSAIKGEGFDPINIAKEAALFAGLEGGLTGLFKIFGKVKELRLKGKHKEAEELYNRARVDSNLNTKEIDVMYRKAIGESPSKIIKPSKPIVPIKEPLISKPVIKGKAPKVELGGRVEQVKEKIQQTAKVFISKPTRKVSDFLGVTDKELTSVGEQAREAVIKYKAGTDKAQFTTEDFVKKSTKNLPKKTATQDSQDMIFFMQGTGNPIVKKGESLGNLSKRLSPQAKQETKEISKFLGEIRDNVNKSGMSEDLGFIENYVTQLWEGDKKQINKAIDYFRTNNPFAKQRIIENYQIGIEKFGLKPKHDNVYDIVREYSRINEKVVQNNLIVDRLKNITHTSPVSGEVMPIISGKEVTGYTKIKNRGLFRSLTKKTGMGETVYVHPEIEQPLKALFESYDPNKFLQSMDQLNAFAKSIQLASSFFHHMALTESALYSGISPLSFRHGKKLINSPEIRNRMIDAGLTLTIPSDVQKALIDKSLGKLSQLPVAGKAFKGLKIGKDLFDDVLWNHYHQGLKAYSFNKKVTQQLAKSAKSGKNLTQKEIEVIEQQVAEHVNNAFGGQNWAAMLKSQEWQRNAHRILLAPDWTLSNARIATDAFVGKGVRKSLARAYWMKAGLYFLGLSNAANYALSGHFMWDNEKGKQFSVDTGSRDKLGRKEYIKFSKQVREPLGWIDEPLRTLGSKSAPTVGIVFELLSGRGPSGYPAIRQDKFPFEKRKSDFEMIDYLTIIGKHFVPFSMSSNNKYLTFPVSRGKSSKQRNKKQKARK